MAHFLYAHGFDDFRDGVTCQSGWGKGDIYNAEVDFHQGGHFAADEFTGTCDFEDGSFYDLGELCEVALRVLEDDVSDDAGAGDSDVQ
jgi:hypothetical protein